jgi:hypothetical protein
LKKMEKQTRKKEKEENERGGVRKIKNDKKNIKILLFFNIWVGVET